MEHHLTVNKDGIAHEEYEYEDGIVIHCSYYVKTSELSCVTPHYSVWATKEHKTSQELAYHADRNPMYAEATRNKVDEWVKTISNELL